MSALNKQKPITMTLDDETKAILKAGAKANDMSVSAYVRMLAKRAYTANPSIMEKPLTPFTAGQRTDGSENFGF